jgi:hypothetical protein
MSASESKPEAAPGTACGGMYFASHCAIWAMNERRLDDAAAREFMNWILDVLNPSERCQRDLSAPQVFALWEAGR